MRWPWIRRPRNPIDPYDPLISAACKGHTDVLEMLLELGWNVNHMKYGGLDDSEKLGTPLHFAAYFGQVEAVKYLLDRGANPNLVSDDFACRPGKSNAEPDEWWLGLFSGQGGWGEVTPLQLAAASGNLEIVRLLFQKGADVNYRSGYFRHNNGSYGPGPTALQIARHSGLLTPERALMLIELGGMEGSGNAAASLAD